MTDPVAPFDGSAEATLARSFYARDGREVAPELLNKVLVHGDASGRIVEVEAYAGEEDPASHGYRGPTPRTATMFGPPGTLYVYFTYGMHWCANAVCGPDGTCSAVLIRALAPISGVESMAARRGPAARRPVDLANGPAKLCQALAIEGAHDGTRLSSTDGPHIVDDGTDPPATPTVTARIGVSRATDRPWRWFVPDEPHVSR